MSKHTLNEEEKQQTTEVLKALIEVLHILHKRVDALKAEAIIMEKNLLEAGKNLQQMVNYFEDLDNDSQE
jgi:hypothetical protein